MTNPEAHAQQLRVKVVYALPEAQYSVTVQLAAGATVADAVERSGLPQRFTAITSRPLHCAIFNRLVSLTEPVSEGDRIEILRPLLMDPKEQRRREAARLRNRAKRS